MKATGTYRTLTTTIKALNDYLNSECTAYQFLYNWRAKDELLTIINIIEIHLRTLKDLNLFEIDIRLTDEQARVIEIALSKEYITDTYLTIQKQQN